MFFLLTTQCLFSVSFSVTMPRLIYNRTRTVTVNTMVTTATECAWMMVTAVDEDEALFTTGSWTRLAESRVLRLRSAVTRGLKDFSIVANFSASRTHASSWSVVGFLMVGSTSTRRSRYMVRYPRATHSATCTCLSSAPSTVFVLSAFTADGRFCSVCITRSTCFWLKKYKINSEYILRTIF